LNQLVDFHEIQQGDHSIEGNRYAAIFNPIASTILKWRMFKTKTCTSAIDYQVW
jgi:hypothetical protein